MTTPAQADAMVIINDLSTQLGVAMRDLAIQRAQLAALQAAQPDTPTVEDTTPA